MANDIETAKQQSKQLLEIEKKYQSELERIKNKQESDNSARAERNYNIQLSKAKTAVQVQKLKQDRISALEKENDDAYLEQLKNTLQAEYDERDRHFRELKYQLNSGVISEDEYYKNLAELRDCYFEQGSQQWYKYSDEIAAYNKKTAENNIAYAENVKQTIIDILSDTADEISSAREKVEKKLNSYTSLFDTIKTKYKNAGPLNSDFIITSTELADLQSQTEVLREYKDALLAVKSRGNVPDSLFDYMRNLDVETALGFAKALLDTTDAQFDEYITAYTDHEKEISDIAAALTSDSADKAISVMKNKLAEVYGEIPDDFFLCGKQSGEEFAEAFGEEVKSLLTNITSALQANIADVLTAGISSNTQTANSYSANYNFYGSAQTVAQQLHSARAAAAVERMRGGYDI